MEAIMTQSPEYFLQSHLNEDIPSPPLMSAVASRALANNPWTSPPRSTARISPGAGVSNQAVYNLASNLAAQMSLDDAEMNLLRTVPETPPFLARHPMAANSAGVWVPETPEELWPGGRGRQSSPVSMAYGTGDLKDVERRAFKVNR